MTFWSSYNKWKLFPYYINYPHLVVAPEELKQQGIYFRVLGAWRAPKTPPDELEVLGHRPLYLLVFKYNEKWQRFDDIF